MLFFHVLVSHNQTKTHTLPFYSFPILIDTSRLICSWIVGFFISMVNKLAEKNCCIIVWFWYQIIPSCFCCSKLYILMFSHIFHGFSKNCVVHQLEKIFCKIIIFKITKAKFPSFMFISMYGLNQASLLDLMTLALKY